MKVWAHIANALERDGSCALVTISSADGSTPRDTGARMVVMSDTSFAGTIGGGTLEFEAIRLAASAARTASSRLIERTVSLGPDLGQCCGGQANLAFEIFSADDLADAKRFAEVESSGHPFATRTIFHEQGDIERELLADLPGEVFAIHADAVTGSRELIQQFGKTNRPLYLFGAGHVGKALILALAPLPFDITWIDSRADQFPGPVPANTKKVCVPDPVVVLEDAPEGAFVLAMTHSHGLDEEIMARALLMQRFHYCGVIGSKTKRARFRKRLKSRGLPDPLLSEMICPVGTPGIKSKHPAAIAAGIAVDLLERDETDHQQVTAGGGLAQIIPHGQ